jgi:hypothetical protein
MNHIANLTQEAEGTTTFTAMPPEPTTFRLLTSSSVKPYANYRFRAVIDWIDLRIVTARPTNFDTVRTRMGIAFAKPLDKGLGGAATEFTVRIQEPTSWTSIYERLEKLTHDHPLAVAVQVTGIEIAMDAYSRTQNRQELVDMVARFFKFATVMTSDNRRTSGEGKGSSQGIGSFKGLRRRVSEGFNIYVGNQSDSTYQHMYVKETTKRDNVVHVLPEAEQRARTEFTFSGQDLKHHDLQGWTEHDFTSDAGYFKYRKLKTRLNPFARYGLEHIDQVGQRQLRKRLHGGTRHFSSGTAADFDLNALTYSALRELTRRMKA